MFPKSEDELRQRDAILSGINVLTGSNDRFSLLGVSEWRNEIRALSRRLQDSESGEAALFQHFGEVLRALDLTLNELPAQASASYLPPIRQAITDQDQHWLALKQTESLKRIETAEREAASAAESAKKAAGTAGGAALTGHFASYAKDEYRRSYLYLGGAIVSLVIAILGALYVIWGGDGGDLGWREGLRAVVSIPLLGLAYFLSREASIHSQSARRAHEIEVRLATIEAFTQVMTEPHREDLRNTLGLLVYSQTDLIPLDNTNSLGKETTEALDTIRAAASATSAASKEIADSSKKIADAAKSVP
jgi:hypothetical protein